MPKVAGIDSVVPAPAHTVPPLDESSGAPVVMIQDRLAGWVSDLTTLHELTERLTRTGSVDAALNEVVRAGAALVGSSRGLVVLEPAPRANEHTPSTTVGLGLSHADLGQLETVPREATSYGRLLDDTSQPGTAAESVGDVLGDPDLDPLHRDVARRLGYSATYAVSLTAEAAGRIGAAIWFYDEPAEPVERQRHLVGLYARYAAEHLARLLELESARAREATIADELLPRRLPRVPGVRLAVRHRTSGHGGDWYDALPLPEGALGLAVGSVSGSGPSALAAMGRLRASLRAYAVMEGEDPVAVLSDLELLLRLTEPARTATALFAYAEPALRKVVLAGAGHAPPLIVGERRTEFVETTLSAPLGMLSCWEAPSVELSPAPGETVLLYTDGLLRRTGDPMDRAFARLHAAAASVPRSLRDDPGAVADHVLRLVLPDGPAGPDAVGGRDAPAGADVSAGGAATCAGAGSEAEDVVILAARFD